MKPRIRLLSLLAIAGFFLFVLASLAHEPPTSATAPPNTGMADPEALVNAFDRYIVSATSNVLNIPLVNLRGLATESFNAGGNVKIDWPNSAVTSEVRGLPQTILFDLWLLDNRPGGDHSTFAEPQDVLLRVGTYGFDAGMHTLAISLGQFPQGFYPDRAIVVRSTQSPLNGFVLTGSSTFFDRLAHRQVRFLSEDDASLGFDPAERSTRQANFAKLVHHGRQLFLNERFSGNGRTCGSCHVESNNFTIDPEFISSLPPSDPLFVADTNPELSALENPEFMRRFGLIVVNADGFDADRGFTLRAVQNVQALGNSTARPDPGLEADLTSNGQNPDPSERLGWGNDGAPLRDFALVAIAQHATKTLRRTIRLDFRIPTDEELDALVAYQLPIGRQEDFELRSLVLKSDQATRGLSLYLDTGNQGEFGHKNCNACHFNGGGTAAFSLNSQKPGFPFLEGIPHSGNVAAPTKVDEIPLALAVGLPRDGGFGQILLPLFGSFGNTQNFGPPIGLVQAEEFNTPPVVESADTAPFFHNHMVEDLESAIAFYGTPAFQSGLFSIGRRLIPVTISPDPKHPEVQDLAAFLRVLNALENIRSSISVAQRGRIMDAEPDARELAGLAQAETIDAIEVLSKGALAETTEKSIHLAKLRLSEGRTFLQLAQDLPTRAAVNNAIEHASRSLRSAREALANPGTLPPSYRN